MRLPGADERCGPLLELEHVQRQLGLGTPIVEGVATIAVAQIIGTTSRAQDFDGSECDDVECAADQIRAARQREIARERSPIGLMLGRAQRRQIVDPAILPLAHEDTQPDPVAQPRD